MSSGDQLEGSSKDYEPSGSLNRSAGPSGPGAGAESEPEATPPAPPASNPQTMKDWEYLRSHQVHVLIDEMVRGLLKEKPQDAQKWMLRWFLEQHRLQCEERYRHNSPQHRPNHSDSVPDVSSLEDPGMVGHGQLGSSDSGMGGLHGEGQEMGSSGLGGRQLPQRLSFDDDSIP